MQSDPLGLEAGFNTYAYVGNNPYRAVDPYGLKIVFAENARSLGRFHLDVLKSNSPTAKKYIDFLDGLPSLITISCGEVSSQKGSNIVWNPAHEFVDREGNLLADASLSLFHELYHVYQITGAGKPSNFWGRVGALALWSSNDYKRWTNYNEKDAIKMENVVWREMGNKHIRNSHNGSYPGSEYLRRTRNGNAWMYLEEGVK